MLHIHPNARTTPAVRAEIARSTEPSGTVARRYGISAETVRKWRKRGAADCLDRSARPHRLPWKASEEERAVVCALRRATNFPLNDLTFVLRHFLPHLNRDSVFASCAARVSSDIRNRSFVLPHDGMLPGLSVSPPAHAASVTLTLSDALAPNGSNGPSRTSRAIVSRRTFMNRCTVRRWSAVNRSGCSARRRSSAATAVNAGCASSHVSSWSRTASNIDGRTTGLTRT